MDTHPNRKKYNEVTSMIAFISDIVQTKRRIHSISISC